MIKGLALAVGLFLCTAEHDGGLAWSVNMCGLALVAFVALTQKEDTNV